MKRITVLLFVCPLFCLHVKGQTGFSDYLPQQSTPEVASLIKYAEYPVSHYTGLVDITIPLYEIVAGEIRIPVTLSYHASGIRLRDENGKIGLGWTLNAGPEPGREMKGRPDDALNGYINLQNGSNYSMFNNLYPQDYFYYRAVPASTWSLKCWTRIVWSFEFFLYGERPTTRWQAKSYEIISAGTRTVQQLPLSAAP
jgi:hypothetical protein